MRIIILVRILWASGAQKIAINEAKELMKMGHQVRLVFLRKAKSGDYLMPSLEGINYEIFAPRNYKVNRLFSTITGFFLPDRKGEGTVDYDLINKFAKSINSDTCDYIICHDTWAGLAGMKIKRRTGIQYSVIAHERVTGEYKVPFLGYLAVRYEKNVFKNAIALFGITTKIANTFERVYNLNCTPNFPGIDLTEFKKFSEKENILLASASWYRDRATTKYLDIIAGLPDFKLIIAGRWNSEEDKDNYIKEVKNRNIASQVIFKQGLAENEMFKLYTDAKFNIRFGYFIKEYGLGTSNVEAISHLTPLIVDELGISDIVEKYRGGFVMKSSNTDSMNVRNAVSLISENNNEEAYDKLQQELREIIKNYYWENHCIRLLSSFTSSKNIG